jgi:hypothetical protein
MLLGDVRVVFLLLDDVRGRILLRLTGPQALSKNESRLVTLIALGALAKVFEDTGLPIGRPPRPTATDLLIGRSVLSEMAHGIAGSASRTAPGFGGLLAFALIWRYRPVMRGSFGVARGAAHVEHRLRTFYRTRAKR